jgi:hypothetical protein
LLWPGTARLHRGMSLAQTPPPLTKAIAQAGLACRGQTAGGLPCQPRSATRSAAAPTSDVCLVHVWATRQQRHAVDGGRPVRRSNAGLRRHRLGRRPFTVSRETKRAAGRSRMARPGFPPTPGSRRRGSVGDHPRSGGRAAYPPAPSDSPSLGTREGAQRPALYVGTSARLAVAPYAPCLASAPVWGTTLRPLGASAIQRSTQRASRRLTACERLKMTPDLVRREQQER